MRPEDRGWLAGIIDGEGCIFISVPSARFRLTASDYVATL